MFVCSKEGLCSVVRSVLDGFAEPGFLSYVVGLSCERWLLPAPFPQQPQQHEHPQETATCEVCSGVPRRFLSAHTHTHSHLLLSDHKQGCKIASHYTHPANRHPDSRSHTPTMTAKWVARPPQYASLHTSHAHMSGVQGRDRFHLWRHCTCIWRLLHAHGDMSGRTSVPGSKQKAHCGGAESDSDVHSEERSVAEHIAETVCCFTMRWSSWIYFGYR
jgi:hypothetical protein